MRVFIENFKKSYFLKSFFSYLFVFIFFFTVFYYIQFSFSYIAGSDDGYRHIKQAWLIRTQGIEKAVRGFSWLECSILKDHPGDPWFGFHLLLYPFTFGDLTFGAKLSSVFFVAILFLAFFWLLRRFRVRYALFWTLSLLFVTDYFNGRLLLPRAYILSILFSLIGFYLIFKKKYLWIFIISFLYGLITVEAPLIIFIALAFTVLEGLREKKVDFKPLISTIFGVLAGLVIRPDFPNSFYLIYHSIFSVLFLRLTGVKLDFGGELSRPFAGSIRDNPLLFLTFTLPFYWIISVFIQKKWRKISPLLLSLFFFSLFFTLLSFGVGSRFVEYWVPFSLLFAAVYFNKVILPKILETIKKIRNFEGYEITFSYDKIGRLYQLIYRALRFLILKLEEKFPKRIVIGLFLFLVIYFVVFKAAILSIQAKSQEPLGFKTIEEGAIWLKENTPPQSVVLNASWDLFPFLFFHNHHNYYCNGMDPTFMYIRNPQNYWLWRNFLFRGLFCDKEKCDPEKQKATEKDTKRVVKFLKEELNGNYLFLTDRNENFIDFLKSSEGLEGVFKRGTIEIYKIK